MMLGYTSTPSAKQELKKHVFINLTIIFILFQSYYLTLNAFHKALALSPSFELQVMTNENRHWVQTYGNSDAHLKSNYTDILAVDYVVTGKL